MVYVQQIAGNDVDAGHEFAYQIRTGLRKLDFRSEPKIATSNEELRNEASQDRNSQKLADFGIICRHSIKETSKPKYGLIGFRVEERAITESVDERRSETIVGCLSPEIGGQGRKHAEQAMREPVPLCVIRGQGCGLGGDNKATNRVDFGIHPLRPSRAATRAVVPEPQNGSSTVRASGANSRKIDVTNSGEYPSRYGYQSCNGLPLPPRNVACRPNRLSPVFCSKSEITVLRRRPLA